MLAVRRRKLRPGLTQEVHDLFGGPSGRERRIAFLLGMGCISVFLAGAAIYGIESGLLLATGFMVSGFAGPLIVLLLLRGTAAKQGSDCKSAADNNRDQRVHCPRDNPPCGSGEERVPDLRQDVATATERDEATETVNQSILQCSPSVFSPVKLSGTYDAVNRRRGDL